MKIIVFVKPILSKYLSNDKNSINEWVINPYDLFALVKVVEAKEKNKNIKIIAVSMGPESAKEVLRRCKAIGADKTVLLSDAKFSGSDTYATTYILEHFINKIGNYNLLVFGKESIDGQTGQVGFGLSHRLNLPIIFGVEEIMSSSNTTIVRTVDEEYVKIVELKCPGILIFNDFLLNHNVSLLKLKSAMKDPVTIWGGDELGIEGSLCGVRGSKTIVEEVSDIFSQKNPKYIEGNINEKVEKLWEIMMYGEECI